jgi:hypothetical protein
VHLARLTQTIHRSKAEIQPKGWEELGRNPMHFGMESLDLTV